MPIEVRLPELGDSITHAKLTVWLKREGETVRAGEPIAEVETDKTNVEIEAPASGTLMQIHVGPGSEGVAIDTLLAVIVEPASLSGADPIRSATDRRADLIRSAEREGSPAVTPDPDAAGPDQQISASPLARRMAHAAGLALSTLVGTGPGGRVTKQDVDAVLRPPAAEPTLPSPPLRPTSADDVQTYEEPSFSPMRRITAERLTHAKQTIPHFYLQTDCRVDAVSRMRNELNARGDTRVSLTAFALRAAALALVRVPAANSSWVDGTLRIYHRADIAVAVETPGGLIAPVIRGAERKPLSSLNSELRLLADRARAGKLKPEDYTGGTFTLSNLGMYGVTGIFPIINPPQTGILGLGAVEQRAVVRDDQVVAGAVMTCTLSADHRAIDGAAGARFLAAFRGLLEDPWSLVL